MTFSRVGMVLSVAVVAAFGLGGCTGEPGPVVTTTPNPTLTSAEPTPSATEPAELTYEDVLAMMPEGAEYQDLRGAMVVAEFFITQYPEMIRSGDTRVWDVLSSPDCVFCSDARRVAIEEASLALESSYVIVGGDMVVVDELRDGAMNPETFVALIQIPVHSEAFFYRMESGDEEEAGAANSSTFSVEMLLAADEWRVTGISYELT